jgi:hypothetical protein
VFEESMDDLGNLRRAATATRKRFIDELNDPETEAIVVFALAALQVEHELVEPAVRARALELIEEGIELPLSASRTEQEEALGALADALADV